MIGSNPGLAFKPDADTYYNVESDIIIFNLNDTKDYAYWVNQLTNFTRRELL